MRDRTSPTPARRLGLRAALCLGAASLVAAPLLVAPSAGAATPLLKSANIPNFPRVLENSGSRTLYELSIEKGAKLHCTLSACLSIWPPVLVRTAVTKVSLGAGVKGKIGFVKRSAAFKQVTFNSYPLYTFKGDTGPSQSNGEAIVADGGTWRMVHASASTPGATPYLPLLNTGNSSPTYKGTLQNTSSRSLYVLSVEKGVMLHCNAGCLSIWPPLLVTATTTKIALGAGVKGTIGFVTRGAMKQVTFNSYPVYTYSGDTGAAQCNGEGIVADGGTWTLASAGATTATGTPVPVGTGCPAGGWARRP